ncbi:MAG: hypothetical protein RMY62_014685 [Nostoc sp. ZfuVER08]|nr:hypothetical protein [Nostoc sp. ZfuVER08]
MTNHDPAQSIRPLVEFIKIQIPVICDRHAEILATQMIARLPQIFAERPEVFSRALSMSGSQWFCHYQSRPIANAQCPISND